MLNEKNKFVWFFLLGMEGDMVIRIEHAGVIIFSC
jgi:hypothetical protein